MPNRAREIYNSWDIIAPEIPERSSLYSLEPIGIGTPYVESLTSYISRLALRHNIRVGDLVKKVIIPEINNSILMEYKDVLFGCPKLLNGFGLRTNECVKALEELTIRNDLSFLTLSKWSNLLIPMNLYHNKAVWCPHCYDTWLKRKQEIYDPLLWKIKCVNFCDIHFCDLVDTCPFCNRHPNILANKSMPGRCSYCNNWLGYPINNRTRVNKEIEKKARPTKMLGEMLKLNSNTDITIKSHDLSVSITKLINLVTGGNITAFSNIVGIKIPTLWGWCKHQRTPDISSILQICNTLNISIEQLLQKKPQKGLSNFKKGSVSPSYISSSTNIKRRKVDKEELKETLLTILNSDEYPPPSMTEVGVRLNRHHTHLRKTFPEISRQISAKYMQYKSEVKRKRLNRMCQEVRDITISLYSKGVFPKEHKVKELMSKPGNFRMVEVRNTFKQTLIELGLRK